MLIGQSGVRELLPRNHRNDRTGFRKLCFFSYSLQRTSHDFENNRKTMLMETNKSLLGWEVSQPPPYAQKKSARCRRDSLEQQEATTHCGSEFENQTLTKEVIVLIIYLIEPNTFTLIGSREINP